MIEYDLLPTFGAWLRELRDHRGLSLREAASRIGCPFSYLQRLETGGRAKKPGLVCLEAVSMAYGVSLGEVEVHAGVRRSELPDPDAEVHHRFRQLMMDPDHRPPGMTVEWCDSFSVKQKRQVLAVCLARVGNGILLERTLVLELLRYYARMAIRHRFDKGARCFLQIIHEVEALEHIMERETYARAYRSVDLADEAPTR
jgi:transcriptional regulator with XRE-family HTH domain